MVVVGFVGTDVPKSPVGVLLHLVFADHMAGTLIQHSYFVIPFEVSCIM